MKDQTIEASYPLNFRQEDAKELGQHLKMHHNVVLVGMKRVGISNFLRFFLGHKDIGKTYINDGKKHLFIPVDLNDLIELEIFPFWTLTLKRIVDAVEKSSLEIKTKKYIENLFLHSIQSQDVFIAIDSVRRSLIKIVENNSLPTLFFIRFDRIKNVVTPEFFANLQGLKDATHRKLNYVFTSFRDLASLSPDVFKKTSLSVFSQNVYIKPAKKEDIKTIYETYRYRYKFKFSRENENILFDLVDGYVQYLHLALIILNEKKKLRDDLFKNLISDERIILQSEELWENLTKEEQVVFLKITRVEEIDSEEKKAAKYLWDTGFINNKQKVFSPIFDHYLKQKGEMIFTENLEFTKKENLLFNFLKENIDTLCEREKIINVVWPEVEAMGVSDWAIDRLVARVRNKLKMQKNNFEIQTIKTRGYKLIFS